VALFSLNEDNAAIEEHCKNGGIAAIYENGFVTIKKGDWKIRVERATVIPLTMNGKAKFMIANVLAATLASYLYGFKIEDIKLSLASFLPGAAQTPGRMNVFKFAKFKVMIDFAHNPTGYRGIEDFLQSVEASRKIGIISGIGDRRDDDIRECGRIAARMFNHIIIRQEKYLRGRTEKEIIDLIIEGINESDSTTTHEVVNLEIDAIRHAISLAQDGTFIVALSDVVVNAIEIVQNCLDAENQKTSA